MKKAGKQLRCLESVGKKSAQLSHFNSKAAISDELQIIEQHELLDAIDDPNELMVRWTLLYVTLAGLELTGRAHWWFVEPEEYLTVQPEGD